MQCTPTESQESFPVVAQETLTYWPALSLDEKAFVAAYVENSYSLPLVEEATGIPVETGKKMLLSQNIRSAVAEVQEQVGSIDFLNEKWVKAQMLRMFPMVMGDEEVSLVTPQGESVMARKFQPDIAMRIVEYIAPKKTQPNVLININNAAKLSDADLEKIAMKGRTYDAQ